VIRLRVHPRLHAALDVHGGCRRINPAGGHKHKSSKQPESHQNETKPLSKDSEEALPAL